MTIDRVAGGGARRVRLELRPSLKNLGVGDDAYVSIGNVPSGATLSAGFGNADRSWLVPATEFNQLDIIAPDVAQPLVLNVRVVSLDPERDSFASTIARFDIHIAPDGEVSASTPRRPAVSASRPQTTFPAVAGPPTVVNRARADRYLPLVDSEDELPQDLREASRDLVLAGASGANDGSAARFTRAMARWQAQELQRWAHREAEMARRQQRELAGLAPRLRVVVDGGHDIAPNERCSAKFAAADAARRATSLWR